MEKKQFVKHSVTHVLRGINSVAENGFSPLDLYGKIGSTYELAVAASKRLENETR